MLFVPATAAPEESPSPAPKESPVPLTPSPASPISATLQTQAAGVVITNVFGAGDLDTERVRLECRGPGAVSLSGWQIKDEDGHLYSFPQLTLYPGGAVDVHTGGGVNDVASLYWGLKEAVWTSGEKATLLDPQGKVQSTYTIP